MAAPLLANIVLDCPDARELAEFYRRLLGWPYREGHEQPDPDGDEWLVLNGPAGVRLAFQRSPGHRPPTWPDPASSQQLHLDFHVPDLDAAHQDALAAGARELGRSDDPDDVFIVYADPAGHPFCLCLKPGLRETP